MYEATGGNIRLVHGRPNYPRDHFVPQNGPNGDPVPGHVYSLWPIWGTTEAARMRDLVDDGPNGALFGLSPQDYDFVLNLVELTKMGSTGSPLHERFKAYGWATCLTDRFGYEAAESADSRFDERRRHGEIFDNGNGYPNGTTPGERLALPHGGPHVSGEWARLSPEGRREVRIRTHDDNQHLPVAQGVYTREAWTLTVNQQELDAWRLQGLVTEADIRRNESLHPNAFV